MPHTTAFQPGRLTFATALSVSMSAFFLLVSYPGILTPDSMISWTEAIEHRFSTFKPPLIAMLQSLFVLIFANHTEAVAAFSFVQGTLFWFSLFYFFAVVTLKRGSFAACCLIAVALFPLWPYTVVHWTDVWVSIFSTFAFAFFALFYQSEYKRPSFLMLCLLCFYLAAATRHNSISVLPLCAIPLVPFLERKLGLSRLFALLVSGSVILLMIAATKIFIFLPNVRVMSLLPISFLNQYIGTIANSSPQIRDKLLQTEAPIFDAKVGSGTLAASVSTYMPSYNGNLVWGAKPIIGFQNLVENGGFLIDRLPRLVMESPRGFLLHKWRNFLGQVDTSSASNPFAWGIFEGPARWGELRAEYLGVSSQPVFVTLNDTIPIFLRSQTANIVYKHWFMLLLGFGAFIFALKLRDILVILTFGYAILYLIPYVLVDVAWEWRYLMPCYVASFLSVMVISLRLTGAYTRAS